MSKAALNFASGLDRLIRRKRAKLTADRVGYFCHPDWVSRATHRPPPGLWQPRIETVDGVRDTADWYRAEGWLR